MKTVEFQKDTVILKYGLEGDKKFVSLCLEGFGFGAKFPDLGDEAEYMFFMTKFQKMLEEFTETV